MPGPLNIILIDDHPLLHHFEQLELLGQIFR